MLVGCSGRSVLRIEARMPRSQLRIRHPLNFQLIGRRKSVKLHQSIYGRLALFRCAGFKNRNLRRFRPCQRPVLRTFANFNVILSARGRQVSNNFVRAASYRINRQKNQNRDLAFHLSIFLFSSSFGLWPLDYCVGFYIPLNTKDC